MSEELKRFVGKEVEVELIRRTEHYQESEAGTLTHIGERFLVLQSMTDDEVEVETAIAIAEIAALFELPPEGEGAEEVE